jgi:hypothetical protein
MRWNEEGKVVEVRDYLDSAMLRDIWEENEAESDTLGAEQ